MGWCGGFSKRDDARRSGGGANTGLILTYPQCSFGHHVKELWDEWEIQCLILVSFFLQVFLFLAASMRTRSASTILRFLLWLAYLSADSIAVFVLGHLAVHVNGPQHQLMLFWAPFLLVHLGGQENLTAFSKEDNDLWKRHLLNLVTQVVVAGYVISTSSWTDHRLQAAVVLMFLCGCLKYTGRTFCPILARPRSLRAASLHYLKFVLQEVQKGRVEEAKKYVKERFESTLDGKSSSKIIHTEAENIGYIESEVISVDTPRNDVKCILAAKDIPSMLKEFYDNPNRRRAYEIVGAQLVICHQQLYTKNILRRAFYLTIVPCHISFRSLLITLLVIVQYMFTPIALVLFMCAEKGGQLHNRADIIISYILLVGAIVLDVFAATMYVCPYLISKLPSERTKSIILWAVNSIRPLRGRKQRSQEVAQYSMITKYTMQDTAGLLSSVHKWISECSNTCGVELLDSTVTHISITEDLKELVLDKLLEFGKVKEDWNFASSRDICYYSEDSTTEVNKKKKVSRELSNYIMYLVFKCGVMLTVNSQLVHDRALREIGEKNYRQQDEQAKTSEKEAVKKFFEANEQEQGASMANEELKELDLWQSIEEALNYPVLPQACQVAAELFSIGNEAERWNLISEIWLEMLYYVAPRCGGAFHYEHLSTGGEFITHVLLLMRFLGPFLPIPTASAP
uniref:DUF4220 domain-containing protein n=1 Tax=Oryza glumipatula TaxID=40148 RepID=A0A0E0AHZ6_9ORYZ